MKSFEFKRFVKPVNQSNAEMVTIVAGNFFLELILPNSFKVNSFLKLRGQLNKWWKSHGETKIPQQITCTKKQYTQYEELLLKSGHPTNRVMYFQGIPLKVRGN